MLIWITTPAHWCTWHVYFASNKPTKSSLPHNMAACTWWPWIQNLVTLLHLIYNQAACVRVHLCNVLYLAGVCSRSLQKMRAAHLCYLVETNKWWVCLV